MGQPLECPPVRTRRYVDDPMAGGRIAPPIDGEPEEFVQDDGDASASMADPVDTPSSLEQADAPLGEEDVPGDTVSEDGDGEEG